MKKKIKNMWNNICNFFRSSLNRLFMGVALLLIAVLIRGNIVLHYLGLSASIGIGIAWIIVAIFYFIMCIWARLTR